MDQLNLIANTGLQFVSTEAEFNPSEPLTLDNHKTLKYNFCETEDIFEGTKTFDLLLYDEAEGLFIPVSELQSNGNAVLYKTNGREELDHAGIVIRNPDCSTILFTSYPDGHPDCYGINSLQSYMVKDPKDGHTTLPAFELMLGKWLPMPMFYKEVDGITSNVPLGWCRVKITKIGEGNRKGMVRYRFDWAFDTETSTDYENNLRPFIEDGMKYADFGLCNKADLMLGFLSSSEHFHAFSDYIASILGLNLDRNPSLKFKAYYIYLVNFLRLSGVAPEVRLYSDNNDNPRNNIPVDLVLDIGNSRTCGILFEEGKFTSGKMLSLRNLTDPSVEYDNKTFDMRIVFRKADFGNDIVLDEPMFVWRSLVRVGEEARNLVYRSLDEEGLSQSITNYSSPKRYLWDFKPFAGQWENLITTDDPYNVSLSNDIYIPKLTDLFDADGRYIGDDEGDDELNLENILANHHHYSRSSLMTFAFVEIFLQAIQQINSVKYRSKWGSVDCRRVLRTVIVTCPTAMPVAEQQTLRRAAQNAFKALMHCIPNLPEITVLPDPEALNPALELHKRQWSFDEAESCQLVYLYAEIAERYKGEIHRFFEMKGHVRPDLKEEDGYEGKSVTIGTVDIGAGTTDLMICAYEYEGDGRTRVMPVPLFWDSYYTAGDDIIRYLVKNLVIEGPQHDRTDQGNISSALTNRIKNMSDQELRAIPCVSENTIYASKVQDICDTSEPVMKERKKVAFAANLIHDFFGVDSAMMGYRDRRCRTDFNTQISVPLVQFMLELLRLHRPSQLYSFDDIFSSMKPASYLLDYFADHFGFRFEELSWRFDPDEVTAIVKATMEPLLKQIALVLYSKQCDVIVLAGRPTSLDAITELFIKYLPISPDRLVTLNDYRVGNWFPTADGQGYFYDQKAIVAVGGMVGHQASTGNLDGLVIDFTKLLKTMKSTANFIGDYNSTRQQVPDAILTPTNSTATFHFSVFPAFIGCRNLDSPGYQARPIFALYNNSRKNSLHVIVSRNFYENPEALHIEEVMDNEGNSVSRKEVELIQQSITADGSYWLDKGEFDLRIR